MFLLPKRHATRDVAGDSMGLGVDQGLGGRDKSSD